MSYDICITTSVLWRLCKRSLESESNITPNVESICLASWLRSMIGLTTRFGCYIVQIPLVGVYKLNITMTCQVRFILMVVNGQLVVSNRKKSDLMAELKAKGFQTFKPKVASADKSDESGNDSERSSGSADSQSPDDDLAKGYDYLLSMKLWSLTMERVQALTSERNQKRDELHDLTNKTSQQLWLQDLDNLETALDEYDNQFIESEKHEDAAPRKATKNSKLPRTRVVGGKPKPKSRVADSESSDEDELSSIEDEGSDDDFVVKSKS